MGSLTEENYIKTIYSLSLEPGEVSVSELAKKLNVKLPTVTSMIKKLSSKKLVSYAPYRGIKITEKGKKEALSIIRKHRLAELFLVKILKLGWEEVHEIAEQLEHVNSERFYNRIDELLGYPKADPHGEPRGWTVPFSRRAHLRAHRGRRRDQPSFSEDPVRRARSHGGATGDGFR